MHFSSQAGEYTATITFQRITNDVLRQVPARGNVSTATMHQVVRRLHAGHAPELTAKELVDNGIIVTTPEVSQDFTLARILNDNVIEMSFKRI